MSARLIHREGIDLDTAMRLVRLYRGRGWAWVSQVRESSGRYTVHAGKGFEDVFKGYRPV